MKYCCLSNSRKMVSHISAYKRLFRPSPYSWLVRQHQQQQQRAAVASFRRTVHLLQVDGIGLMLTYRSNCVALGRYTIICLYLRLQSARPINHLWSRPRLDARRSATAGRMNEQTSITSLVGFGCTRTVSYSLSSLLATV